MSLLFQAICEYLEDNCKPWYAVEHYNYSMTIEHPGLDSCVRIYPNDNMIVAYIYRVNSRQKTSATYYTDHTIIQCVDEMIKTVKTACE